MKVSNPKSRYHLNLPAHMRVLEVGGGHNPHQRSNVVVDKYIDSNYHRCGDVKFFDDQEFINADGSDLPFDDNEFDYVICNHVLEHVDDPVKFLKEQARVSKRGYIEIPSLIGEYMHPKASHKWLILEIDGKLVLMDKDRAGFQPSHDLGEIFLEYLPKNSIGYKIMQHTHQNIFTVRYEWEGDIEVLVNPSERKYTDCFMKEWTSKEINQFLPQRSLIQELREAIGACGIICKTLIKSRLFVSKNDELINVESSVNHG